MTADQERMMLWLPCAVLVVLAGICILMPLFRESTTALDIDLLAETELDRLLDRKAVIYRNIKDLELEYAMGKLSDADFHGLEADYKNDAAIILGKLDQLGASEGLDEAIEKDIASRKVKMFAPISTRAQETLRCPSCGAEIITGEKFCADCGQRL